MPVDFSKEGQNILDIEDELSIAFPKDFMEFYRETGFGFLCADDSGKKGHYRVFAPGELLDLYFEPEDEDGEDEGQDEGPEVSQDENQANAPGSSRPSQEDREESPGGNSSGTSGGSTER